MRRFVGLILIILTLLPVCTVTADEKLPRLQETLPIDIASDRLEADDAARQVSFVGHVVVRQGMVSLYAQKVLVRYGAERQDVERLDAEGDVRIVQGERIATARSAVMYNLEKKIVLSGGAQVQQGQDSVQGEEITVFLDQDRSVVSSRQGGRVKAVFHPRREGT